MLAFFSISIGLWENFRQLWLQDNGFSATDVSNITSIGMLVSVIGVLFVGRFIKMSQLKNFIAITLVARFLNLAALFCVNGSDNRFLIDLAVVIDSVTGYLIITSVYPLLTTIKKSNSTYSKRKLVEYLFRDVGILVGGIVIGHSLGPILFDYNGCLLLAILFLFIAIAIMYRFDFQLTERAPARKFSALKYIIHSKIQRVYMLYAFLAGASFTAAIGLKMLMLTDFFDLTASMATNYLLVVGLLADLIGILALKYFTPQNDYITISLKFGIRLIIFAIAFFSNSLFLSFIALTWVLLSSTAYENISDGYYINAVDNRHQLKYHTLKYVVTYSGDAVGMFLCGQMYNLGAAYIFGLSAAILIVQIVIAYYLIYIRQKASRP